MVSWVFELSKYEIQHIPIRSIKSHVFANFVEEFSSPIDEKTLPNWMLSVDGASNVKGRNIEIVL